MADLLLLHGLVMNGGVHHAVESLGAAELAAAADGYSFFGLGDVALFLRGAGDDPTLCKWTDETEGVANRRYSEMVPDDGHLFRCFERVFKERRGMFAPVEHAR